VAKIWDDLMKMLAGANPQHLVSWLLPGAHFEKELVTEMKNRTIEADLLYIVTWNKKKTVLHVEFQRRRDSKMGKRLWEYNVMATYISGLPVCSFAIYIKKGGSIVGSPYEQKLPNEDLVHVFFFRNIKLWEISSELLKQPGIEGLLPLLPLTKEGTHREVVDDMIAGLNVAERQDLLPLGYAFAALIFNKEGDREWLRGKFIMDMFEESWAYQEMVKKGLEKGLQQGLKKGELQAQRETLLGIVQARFPELSPLTKKQMGITKDPQLLRNLTVKISTVQTANEAEQLLIALTKDQKKH
jgi:hypothetical protein